MIRCVSDQLSAAVAAEVRRLLEERGWSARELTRRTGISQPTLARKLRGQPGHEFGLDEVDAVCRAFEIQVEDLMKWAQRS